MYLVQLFTIIKQPLKLANNYCSCVIVVVTRAVQLELLVTDSSIFLQPTLIPDFNPNSSTFLQPTLTSHLFKLLVYMKKT